MYKIIRLGKVRWLQVSDMWVIQYIHKAKESPFIIRANLQHIFIDHRFILPLTSDHLKDIYVLRLVKGIEYTILVNKFNIRTVCIQFLNIHVEVYGT